MTCAHYFHSAQITIVSTRFVHARCPYIQGGPEKTAQNAL